MGLKKMGKRLLGKAALRAVGWREDGPPPQRERYVLIAAPHTSNWDLPITLALSFAYDVPIRWMGKHTLFRGPAGLVFRALGGVPIIRHERRNMVQQMIDLFAERDQLVLMVPSEGTRSRVDRWKSGFYRIAEGADVPIVLGFLDYEGKRGGFGEAFIPSGDVRADMDVIRTFYADKVGKHPDKFAEPRLKEEGD